MAPDELDEALAELAELEDDFGARDEILNSVSFSIIRKPALGGRLITMFCATKDDSEELDSLTELIGAVLEVARTASESGKKRGDDVLKAMTEAVDLATNQQQLSSLHRMMLSSAWTQARLQAPESLELTLEGLVEDDMDIGMLDDPEVDAEVEALTDNLFLDLLDQTGGDAFDMHSALKSAFPAMPIEMRAYIIAWSVDRQEPIHDRLVCFWLLDTSAQVRRATANALAARAEAGGVSAELAGRMAMLRSWMPDDDARAAVDHAVKTAMPSGLTAQNRMKPWTIRNVLATLPDGGGAQSIMIALQLGRSRKTALTLLKHGQGITDAFCTSCASATEQKALSESFEEEAGAVNVPMPWVEHCLAMALAEGLTAGLSPAPGIIEVAEHCGLNSLRPESRTTEALIADLPGAEHIRNLSTQARSKLINASEHWWDRHSIAGSWFEDSDHAHEALEGEQSQSASETALWRWLETRRDFWTRIVACAADVLAAAGHPDADSFIATAITLLDGRDLKKIPFMAEVHHQTLEEWMFEDADLDYGGACWKSELMNRQKNRIPNQR